MRQHEDGGETPAVFREELSKGKGKGKGKERVT